MAADYLVIDNFLPSDVWWDLREYYDTADFSGETGRDGVTYPNICMQMPVFARNLVLDRLKEVGNPDIQYLFARMSESGIYAQHKAHSDLEWGEWSMMLYMNRLEDCIGGTSFVRHDLGFSEHPINQKQLDACQRDTNRPEKWQIHDMCAMVPNRAVIFPAKYLHRAEPVGGFGNTQENSRLVLTAFFNDSSSD